MDNVLGFLYLIQREIISLVNITAENIEDKIPIDNVTAKPLTGPEPKASSARPAIKVVMFESRMVAQARSKP